MALKEIHQKRLKTDLGRLEENWVIKNGTDDQGKEIDIEGPPQNPSICDQPVNIETTSIFFTRNPLEENIIAPKCTFTLQRRFELFSGKGKLSSFTEDGKRIEEAFQTKPDSKKIHLGDIVTFESSKQGVVIGLIPHQGKNKWYAVINVHTNIQVVDINQLGVSK